MGGYGEEGPETLIGALYDHDHKNILSRGIRRGGDYKHQRKSILTQNCNQRSDRTRARTLTTKFRIKNESMKKRKLFFQKPYVLNYIL